MKNIMKKIILPEETKSILESTVVIFPKSREELFSLALGNDHKFNDFFDVYYTIPGIGKIVECTVAQCKNGLAIYHF